MKNAHLPRPIVSRSQPLESKKQQKRPRKIFKSVGRLQFINLYYVQLTLSPFPEATLHYTTSFRALQVL